MSHSGAALTGTRAEALAAMLNAMLEKKVGVGVGTTVDTEGKYAGNRYLVNYAIARLYEEGWRIEIYDTNIVGWDHDAIITLISIREVMEFFLKHTDDLRLDSQNNFLSLLPKEEEDE